jgi:hypothetical protein
MDALHERRCGECTACCDLFPVEALEKAENEKCIHCDGGCTIYDERPQACINFNCAYLQSTASVELRPDKCGVVFEKISDRIFYGVIFKRPTKKVSSQVSSFLSQGYSVFMATNTKLRPTVEYFAEGHDEEDIRSEFLGYLTKSMEAKV